MGDLHLKLDQIKQDIHSWDMQEENGLILSNADVVEDAKVTHASLTLNLARKWGQRAKENWAKDAEKNTS